MIVEMENAKLIERYNLEYANLMKYFLYVTKSHVEEANVLNDLKNYYSSVIDSARTYDYIDTLEDLLRILEKRNVLSHDNITALIHIEARYVRNPKLARSLNDYEKTLGQRPSVPLFNIYDLPGETPYASRPGVSGIGASNSDDARRPQIRARMTLYTTEPRFHLTLPGSVEIDPTERNSDHENEEVARAVFLEVSEKVGRHWRDVARFLGVTEHDIDEIDYHSKLPLKEKAYQALLKFQSKCNPPQWKPKLARALEKARRRDLMEMVEELWSRKY